MTDDIPDNMQDLLMSLAAEMGPPKDTLLEDLGTGILVTLLAKKFLDARDQELFFRATDAMFTAIGASEAQKAAYKERFETMWAMTEEELGYAMMAPFDTDA